MGIFFEIITPDGKINYLLGTMHTNGKDVCKLPAEIKFAIEKAQTFIFECDTTESLTDNYYQVVSEWFWKAREEIPIDSVSEIDIAAYNFQHTPISFYMGKIGQQFSHHFVNTMEAQLISKLKLQGLPIAYLESLDDQRITLEGYKFDYLQQQEFYQFMVKQPNPDIANLEKLFLSENIEQLIHESNPYWQCENNEIPECVTAYHLDLIQNRDPVMAKALLTHFEKGNSFAAVGAAHLIGIIEFLSQKGLTVNPITLGERETSIMSLFGTEVASNLNNFWTTTVNQSQDPKISETVLECNPQ